MGTAARRAQHSRPLPVSPRQPGFALLQSTEAARSTADETSIYYYLQRAFAVRHTFIRMQTGLESIGLTGAQHETNVTASVRHCDFINGRTGACTGASTGMELAAGPHGQS